MKGSIFFDESMTRHTTFRIGGPADRLVVPVDLDDLRELFRDIPEEEPVTVVGAGSNLLVLDQGIRGTVVMMKGLDGIRIQENKASVGAGVMLPGLLRKLIRRGLGGMEWSAGIPGSVGGAVRMNAGTREGCMADRLASVTLMHRSGRTEKKERSRLTFGYRRMELCEDTWIVEVELLLDPKTPEEIEQRVQKQMNERRRLQPLGLPSAGSIFKNPEGDFAGRLIEAAGMKGARIGDAEVSQVHANFIVNRGRARAEDVLALVQKIKDRVADRVGINLELEIKIVGETVQTA